MKSGENRNKMPKYKFRNFYKTLLQIWLFYYFLNTVKVYECQPLDDVEFISSTKTDENDVSEFHKEMSEDSEFAYEPIEPNKNNYHSFGDEIDDSKNVNLNVNNNLPSDSEVEAPPEAGDVPTHFTEINEQEISGEKVLHLSDSPFLLRQDLQILRHAKLIVEPGVTVHFAPMVGITVHGQMKAIVSSKKNYERKIIHKRTDSPASARSFSYLINPNSIPNMFALRQV